METLRAGPCFSMSGCHVGLAFLSINMNFIQTPPGSFAFPSDIFPDPNTVISSSEHTSQIYLGRGLTSVHLGTSTHTVHDHHLDHDSSGSPSDNHTAQLPNRHGWAPHLAHTPAGHKGLPLDLGGGSIHHTPARPWEAFGWECPPHPAPTSRATQCSISGRRDSIADRMPGLLGSGGAPMRTLSQTTTPASRRVAQTTTSSSIGAVRGARGLRGARSRPL